MICNIEQLPFKDDSIEEIYAGHVLEHCSSTINALLECKRVLEPGGLLAVVVPDCERAATAEGIQRERIMFGDGGRLRHKHLFTESYLRTCLEVVGFKNLRPLDKNDCRLAVKGVSWQIGWQALK